MVMPASAGPVLAEAIYIAALDGPASGTNSPATGSATLTLNTAGTEVSYVVTFTGLTGAETGAHFHNAPPGMAGPRFHTLIFGSPKIGTWAVGPVEVAELNEGRVYINIHSTLFGAGEIRGNIEPMSVAVETVSWGAVKALYE